jgi:gamma-glutamyltranspeptidase/glutathione hydrolase
VLAQPDYAETLRAVAAEGAAALHGGALGGLFAEAVKRRGGIVTEADLRASRPVSRAPIRAEYRGLRGLRPAATRLGRRAHRADAEHPGGFDLAALGFGTPEAGTWWRGAENRLRRRAAATADPDFVQVPSRA